MYICAIRLCDLSDDSATGSLILPSLIVGATDVHTSDPALVNACELPLWLVFTGNDRSYRMF